MTHSRATGADGARDLRVYQRSLELVVACYGLAQRLPSSERFGLADQLRRAASSVPANIMELRAHLDVARELGYVVESDTGPAEDLAIHVSSMLMRLAHALRKLKRPAGGRQ